MRFGQNHHQQQQQLLYQYRCSQCGAVLKETKTPLDSSIFRSINNERCANCGNVLQEQTVIVVAVQHPPLRSPQNNISPPSPHPVYALQSQLPMIFETAYDIEHRSTKLAFDIAEIDSLLDLPDRGGSICVASSRKSRDGGGWHANTLVTRLCVRALMSRRHGGFGSSSVIFIDAGNCSDIYQCVNFARQYGLDIQKVLDSIMVSRPFTIHQLAGLLIYELESAAAIHRFGAKLVVVSDMLKMFSQEAVAPQLDHDEAQWLLREIAKSLQRISSQALVVISLNNNNNNHSPLQYRSFLPHCDNRIDITTTVSSDGSHNLHLEITNHRHHDSKRHCLSLPEKEVQFVLAR